MLFYHLLTFPIEVKCGGILREDSELAVPVTIEIRQSQEATGVLALSLPQRDKRAPRACHRRRSSRRDQGCRRCSRRPPRSRRR